MKKKIRCILGIVVLLFIMVGCGQKKEAKEEVEQAGQESLMVTDMAQKKITFSSAPQKIVALQASDVESLYAIGAGDKIVGVGEYCNYPKEALDKTKVASGAEVNIEQIISLAPDVVIMGNMAQTPEQVKQLEAAGVKVVSTNAQNIESTYETITLLGQVTQAEKEADQVIKEMKMGFEELRKKAGDGSKKVYYEVSPLEYGLWTTGKATFMQELSDMIGVKNIFDDVNGWVEVSEEQVLERNPDYIVTVAMYQGTGETPVDEILGRKAWKEIPAVKNQKVYQADNDMTARPGPRLLDAAKDLYQFIYGE